MEWDGNSPMTFAGIKNFMNMAANFRFRASFINTWNDFLGPLIYLKTEAKKTLQLGLKMFLSQYSSEYGLIMAASVLALIPVLIVFLSLQKYFVEGVAATGVKG